MDSQNNQQTPSSQNPPVASTKSSNTLMEVLSYLGPLVIVSYIMSKDTPEIKFHVKQGAAVFLIEVIVWLLAHFVFIWMLWPILDILNLVTLVLSVIGIINVVQDKQKELPVIGAWANGLNI
jgi:uncharacterized membrane protein